jgi:hypothetical protein
MEMPDVLTFLLVWSIIQTMRQSATDPSVALRALGSFSRERPAEAGLKEI